MSFVSSVLFSVSLSFENNQIMKEQEKLTIKEWAEADRPREKMMAFGSTVLSDAELLAILIGSGTKEETAVDLAKRMLSTVDNNLNELGKQNITSLCRFKGIGPARAVSISAALELGRRRKLAEPLDRPKISAGVDVYEIFHPILADLPHEELWMLLLNRSNIVLDRIKLSQGGISATIADIKIIVKTALDHLASAVILVHNHPSGNREPGKEDKNITYKLKEALDLFEIILHDHVIIANNRYFSFAGEGLL